MHFGYMLTLSSILNTLISLHNRASLHEMVFSSEITIMSRSKCMAFVHQKCIQHVYMSNAYIMR